LKKPSSFPTNELPKYCIIMQFIINNRNKNNY
jgi:hypothetical protein